MPKFGITIVSDTPGAGAEIKKGDRVRVRCDILLNRGEYLAQDEGVGQKRISNPAAARRRIVAAALANPSAIFKNKGRRGGGLRRSVFSLARL